VSVNELIPRTNVELPGCACLFLYWLTHITCLENKWWWWWWV